MKQLSINKTGNIRPSSGYQSYNNTNISNNNFHNKGNDSDIESGRNSPNVRNLYIFTIFRKNPIMLCML